MQLVLICLLVAIQIPAEQTVWSGPVTATEEAREYHLHLQARTAGASWADASRACGLLRLTVDGTYDQHIFLAAGSQWADYDVVAGPMAPGVHDVRLTWFRDWTPGLERAPELRDVRLTPVREKDPAQEPVLRSPSIWLRADTIGRFSDVPLVMYYEEAKTEPGTPLVYTIIMTNEDGGTNTERLMARWGRTTDIEWCYSYPQPGSGVPETFQGRDHKVIPFRGRYDGWHPNLYDVTRNNVFSDTPSGSQPVRVRPIPVFADLSRSTRESVMDRFPWLYRVMADEMEREGKIESPADPLTNAVSDLLNYVYVDVCADQRGTELRFEAQLKGNPRRFSSDHLDPKARIERSGCFRSSIELPPGSSASQIGAVQVQCLPVPLREGERPAKDPRALIHSIERVFTLGQDYRPQPSVLTWSAGTSLKPGKSLMLRPGALR
jgi:hypothetical protein